MGFELEDAEEHGTHKVAFGGLVFRLRGHEMADAEGCLLFLRDIHELLSAHDALAEPDVAMIDMLRVGGDHPQIARIVKQLQHAPIRFPLGSSFGLSWRRRVPHLFTLDAQPRHSPSIQHRRRRNNLPIRPCCRELLIQIVRIPLVHSLAPMPNHRHIHQVRRNLRAPFHANPGPQLFQEVGHRSIPSRAKSALGAALPAVSSLSYTKP